MYAMQCFELPITLCEEMERMCKNFWWGQVGDENRMALISWDSMSKPKQEGGLGFRNFSCFNRALLAKQGWRLIQYPESLAAQVLKAKYYPRSSFWEATGGHQPSFTWRSLLKGRELLKEGCYWRVGNGTRIKIWKDKWLPKSHNHLVHSTPRDLPAEANVSALIDHVNRAWRVQTIRQIFSHAQAEEIISIPLSNTDLQDELMWGCSKDGSFNVKSATSLARSIDVIKRLKHKASCSSESDGRWTKLWKASATPRAKNLCWRACRDALPTCVNLYKRGIEIDVICPICGNDYETLTHILLDCDFARDFWRKSPFRLCTSNRRLCEFGAWCHDMLSVLDEDQSGLLVTLIWGLWSLRNKWVFEKKRENVEISLGILLTVGVAMLLQWSHKKGSARGRGQGL